MSKKSTKIIAAAGVVAGLGVAALPAMTFATAEVKGDVLLKVDVPDAIAIKITGNNDGNDGSRAQGVNVYAPGGVTQIDNYDATDTNNPGTEYNPSSLQVSSSSISILPNTMIEGTATASQPGTGFYSTVTVFTNDDNGYSLTVAPETPASGATAGDLLLQGASIDYSQAENVIPANASLSAGTSAWALKGGDITSWTAATESRTIKAAGSRVANGEVTQVFYGVSTSATQKAGTYKGNIIYTATNL